MKEHDTMITVKTSIDKKAIQKAEKLLTDNGIDGDEAAAVLQALGYVLLNTELYPEDKEDRPRVILPNNPKNVCYPELFLYFSKEELDNLDLFEKNLVSKANCWFKEDNWLEQDPDAYTYEVVETIEEHPDGSKKLRIKFYDYWVGNEMFYFEKH